MTDEELDAIIEADKKPRVVFRFEEPGATGAPGCWFGGAPSLPPEIDWPFSEKLAFADVAPYPLQFVMQINCAQVPVLEGEPDVPHEGYLFIFYEGIYGGTGAFDGLFRIIYSEQDCTDLPPRAVPELPEQIETKLLSPTPISSKMYKQTHFTPLKSWAYIHESEKLPAWEVQRYSKMKEEKEKKECKNIYENREVHYFVCENNSWLDRQEYPHTWESDGPIELLSVESRGGFIFDDYKTLILKFTHEEIASRNFNNPTLGAN